MSYLRLHPAPMLIVGVTLLTLAAGVLMPYAQQRYFGGQLAQLDAAKSAIRDPLTADTLHWMPAPSDNPSQRFLFTPSGYVFPTDACCDLNSRVAQPMSNGLVEVTAHQQSQFDLAALGILFRADAGAHSALVFMITADGQWRLSRFTFGGDGSLSDENTLRYEGAFGGIGGVRAIHQGSDATNRIAVLMQGPSYTFFVNGQFVGGYTANDLPLSGQIGVYADGLEDAVTFSDLLIAPV